MCGWCTEQEALEIFQDEKLNSKYPDAKYSSGWDYLLRETTDFVGVFRKFSVAYKTIKTVEYGYLPDYTIVLRAIELLVTEGYASEAYQSLKRKRLFKKAVRSYCSKNTAKMFSQLSSQFSYPEFAPLYHADTYLKGIPDFRTLPLQPILSASVRLLKHYRKWWLESKEDIEQRKRESKELLKFAETFLSDNASLNSDKVEIIDTEYEPLQEEIFYTLLPCICFAIHLLGHHKAGAPLLRNNCTYSPRRMPNFDHPDLWLQRVAAKYLFKIIGFERFAAMKANFRGTLYFYVDLAIGLTDEEKDYLVKMVQKKPELDDNDDNIRIMWWLGVVPWYRKYEPNVTS